VETIDLFLLGGSYRQLDDGVVIELYGRARSGEAVVARYYGFRPYFVLSEPTAEERERLSRESQVVEVRDVTLFSRGQDRPAARVTVRYPWTVPDFRERYRRHGDIWSVLACDIPFVHRFLYDKGLGLGVRFRAEPEPEEVRALYTVAKVVKILTTEGDIEPIEPFRPDVDVLSFDIENAIRTRTIFTICGVFYRGDQKAASFQIGGPGKSEREVVEEFVRTVQTLDPDVITGYNIGGYDFPLLLERAKALGIRELALGRDRAPPSEAGERLWRLHGRVIADVWWAARMELRPKQETLQFVARLLLGEGKLDVDRRNIEAEWERDPVKVMQYCETDARLALQILYRLRTLYRAADLATVARLPLEEGLNGRTSLFVDSILIPRADRWNIGVPPNRFGRRETPIEGGYVHTIRPGLYPWVVVLDFKAMYPSIIISRNICFTTLMGADQPADGAIVAPNGIRFLPPARRRGVIPQILQELLAQRDAFRQKAREAPTPALAQYYDGLQNAVKILMNSFYGVLASSFYRFTDKDIGAAITAFGREAITGIIQAIEKDGYTVVYSDTDSVFVTSPKQTLEGAKEFGQLLAQRFTEKGVTFEFQAVYSMLFSHGAKKRYVGRLVWPKDDTVIRGYETQRTDTFDYQSDALRQVFDLVLEGDTPKALARARELVLECAKGNVPAERLIIARTVRPEEEYNAATRDTLPFLRVFRQLRSEGFDVIPGMKVAWIVTNARKSPQEVEPIYEGRPFPADKRPDFEYYADRVAQTLARVTEVFGWEATDLVQGHHQQRLGEPDALPVTGAALGDPVTMNDSVADLAHPGKRTRKNRTLTEF
jgi:DNA polymerase I